MVGCWTTVFTACDRRWSNDRLMVNINTPICCLVVVRSKGSLANPNLPVTVSRGCGRFLTISERLSSFQAAPVATAAAANSSQALSYRNLGAHGSSSNVFIASVHPMDTKAKSATSALVGTDYILNVSTRTVPCLCRASGPISAALQLYTTILVQLCV